jgi:hypothetical protein
LFQLTAFQRLDLGFDRSECENVDSNS